jgi:hypothetical protein
VILPPGTIFTSIQNICPGPHGILSKKSLPPVRDVSGEIDDGAHGRTLALYPPPSDAEPPRTLASSEANDSSVILSTGPVVLVGSRQAVPRRSVRDGVISGVTGGLTSAGELVFGAGSHPRNATSELGIFSAGLLPAMTLASELEEIFLVPV